MSDQASSIISSSPSRRPGSATQSQSNSYFNREASQYEDSDDTPTPQPLHAVTSSLTHEAAQPDTTEMDQSSQRSTSALAEMLRKSPPTTAPQFAIGKKDTGTISRQQQARRERDMEVAVLDDDEDMSSGTTRKSVCESDECTPFD